MKYYVYLLVYPESNIPFYVGKGHGKRAEYHIIQNQRGKPTENPYKDHVIKQILSEGKVPIIEYVFRTDSEEEAYAHEAQLIKKFGRKRFDENGILTNLCEDNRPPHNTYSEERRRRYKEMMIGNTINKGRQQSREEKQRRADSLKNAYATGKRVVTEKMREASSKTHKGKIVSEETSKRMSASAKKSKAWRHGLTNEEIFGKEKAEQIRIKKQSHKPSNRKEITVDGITYESIKEAAKKLNTTEYKVRKLNDHKKV